MIGIFLTVLGIVLCIALSAFFSGTEMSFLSCSELRMENEAGKGNKRAARMQTLLAKHDDVISAILIGNNLVNTAASSLTTVLVILLTGTEELEWVASIIITILIIIFGETVPKILAKRYPNRIALRLAPVLHALEIVFRPLNKAVVWAVNVICRTIRPESETADEEESVEELQSIIETAEDEGILEPDESEMASAAIDFADISASEVMTSRVDLIAIDIDDDDLAVIDTCMQSRYSRLPVYDETIDHIVGILHLNQLFRALSKDGETDFRTLLREPCYVYKTMKLPQVLDILKKNKQHVAVVTDEYGGTLGMITLEDVLEQIVGEIWDENDVIEEEIVKVSPDTFEVDGDLNIDDFRELLERTEEQMPAESETAGGWAIETMEDFPKDGDTFTYDDFTFTAKVVEERRVEKLTIKRKNEAEEA